MIGNLLSTRKWEVVFVAPGRPDKWIRIPGIANSIAGHKRTLSEMEKSEGSVVAADDRPLDPSTLPEGDPEVEIESLIIPALEDLHTAHIEEARGKQAVNGKA